MHLADLIVSLTHYEVGTDLQGTTVRVEYGDATTAIDSADAHSISRYFPHTYGQPLAHFLRATAKVPDAQIITEHPAIRFVHVYFHHSFLLGFDDLLLCMG